MHVCINLYVCILFGQNGLLGASIFLIAKFAVVILNCF